MNQELGIYPKTSLVAQTVKHLPTMQETQVRPWVGKILWRRKWQPTGKSHGRRSMVGYSPWGRKESDMTERLHSLHEPKHFCRSCGIQHNTPRDLPTAHQTAGRKTSVHGLNWWNSNPSQIISWQSRKNLRSVDWTGTHGQDRNCRSPGFPKGDSSMPLE